VLTWVTGGTPPGPPPAKRAAETVRRGWAKGRPDLVIPVPAVVNLPADKTEDTREFVLRDSNDRDRTLAFVDLQPGNPAIVHDATIFTRRGADAQPSTVVALWLPGGEPAPGGAGIGFAWRAGEQLVVRLHYKKNWKLENKSAYDRSSIGLYFAKASASRTVRSVPLNPGQSAALGEALQGVAVRSADGASDTRVEIDAIRPDGSRVRVAGFVTRAGWDQRYWLASPVDLPRGSRLDVRTAGEAIERIHLWLDAVPAGS